MAKSPHGFKSAGLLEKTLLVGMKLKAPEVKNKHLQLSLNLGAWLGRGGSKILTYYFEGGLYGEKKRKPFVEGLGITDAQWTKGHSLIFGIGGMLLEGYVAYAIGQEAKEAFVPGLLSDILHISYNSLMGGYVFGVGLIQNVWRFDYARRTNKGMGAVGAISFFTHLDYYIPRGYKLMKFAVKKALIKRKIRKKEIVNK